MGIVEASGDSGFEKSHNLLGNSVAPFEAVETNDAAGVKEQTSVDIWRKCHNDVEQDVEVQKRDAVVKGWFPTQIVLFLVTLMLIERGVLDADEKASKYWPGYVTKRGKDVEVRQLLPQISSVSALEQQVAIQNMTELVRRIDGRSLKQFIAEDIASPLGLDLHPWLVDEQQEESDGRPRIRPQSLTTGSEGLHPRTDPIRNGQTSNGIPRNNEHKHTSVKKLYPETIPAHQSHPSACDFSIIDQSPIGKALVTHRSWQQGDFMARFDGLTVPEVMLHTLQKTTNTHLWDPHFIGNLAHSCHPNVMLDMVEHEMWAVQDIEAGTLLTMDYASTEDYLFRTFQCKCAAPGCRGEVTGRKQRRSTLINVSHKHVQ